MESWISTPEGRTAVLGNWRQPPHSRWAFANLRNLLPSETIDRRVDGYSVLKWAEQDIESMVCEIPGGLLSLAEVLARSSTDAFLVLKDKAVVAEYYFGDMRADTRHVMFSVSKSVLGLLFGILRAKGLIDLSRPVARR